MILRVLCEDCDLERIVFGEDVAQGKMWKHEQETEHTAYYETIK
jgi:hypothetical protein